MAYMEEWEEAAKPFRLSAAGLDEAINSYRAAHDVPALQSSRILNFNAYDRGVHFLKTGIGEGQLWETVRMFDDQDTSDGVELYSQWSSIEQPATYLKKWSDDPDASKVLLDPSFTYMGLASNVLPVGNKGRFITAVIVLVMTRTQQNR